MSEKEKYLDLIQVIDGKESWKGGVMTSTEDTVFGQHPEKAWALIYDDPKNIGLFSISYLSEHRAMVDYVFNLSLKQEREYLKYIPYQLLRGYYREIQKYVGEHGLFLKNVPMQLQNDFVQIPYDAVKQDPTAIMYASVDALIAYPDICMLVLKQSWRYYWLIPVDVRLRYDFKNMIR